MNSSRSTASPIRSRLAILAAAALFSTGGAAIKAASLTSWQVACFRSGIAALAVLVFLPAARRGIRPRTLAVGVAYAATLILFVRANKLTTSANSIFLQSTAPLYVLLLAPLILREKFRARDLGFVAAIGAGLLMFFVGSEQPWATAPDPFQGNVVAVLSGLTWAATVMGLRGMARGEGATGSAAITAVLTGNTIAFLACLPWALPIPQPAFRDVLVLVYLGVFQIGLAYVFLARGMRHVGALDASLLLLVEPVLNPIWAWLVQGERPGAWALGGGALIIGATALRSWIDYRAAPPRQDAVMLRD